MQFPASYLNPNLNSSIDLEHKSIRERDGNEILYEKTILLEKENNCSKNKIKNQRLITQMLISNKNGKTLWKSSKLINPDFPNKPGIPTLINLTNRFKSLHVAEENSGPANKNNDVTPKHTIPNDKPRHVMFTTYIKTRTSTHYS